MRSTVALATLGLLAMGAGGVAAQEAPKKKPGFLERLNRKLEEVNRKANGGTAPPPARPEEQPAAAETSARRIPHTVPYTPRAGSCAPFSWTPAPVRLREAIPSSEVHMIREPNPAQPEGDFTFESFGKTRTLRVTFPSVRSGLYIGYRDPATRQYVNRMEWNEGTTEPYEVEFAFAGDTLWHASCEKGTYRDHGPAVRYENNWLYFNRPESFVREGNRDVDGRQPELRPFVCADCYFVDHVFRSGLDLDQFVVLVAPSKPHGTRYYFVRVSPEPTLMGGAPANDICELRGGRNGSDHCFRNSAGVLAQLHRETGPNTMLPGLQMSYWLVQCKGSPCQVNLGFDDVVPLKPPTAVGIPLLP